MLCQAQTALAARSGVGAAFPGSATSPKVAASMKVDTVPTFGGELLATTTCGAGAGGYRGTSLIRNSAPLRPYSRKMSRALWQPLGGELSLMSEVPLYIGICTSSICVSL